MPQAPSPIPAPARRRAGAGAGGIALRALVLAAAGAGCWLGATEAAALIERRSAEDVRLALASGGFGWTTVGANGLQVTLGGTAPDEGARFRAITQASGAVGPGRIVDAMEVARRDPAAPPDFRIELLRSEAGLSMIGLIPAGADRRALARQLADGAGQPAVTDLLETADYPAPDGWPAALAFGTNVIATTPRAKVSVAPGRVSVTALADTPRDKARLETALTRAKPADVALTMDITAPRPVIAPFTLRFVKDEAGARFDACAADTDTSRQQILGAAEAAGAAGGLGCTLGLGAPGANWGEAVVPAIEAVGALGAGAVTFSDADVALDAAETVPQALFDAQVARLEERLPAGYRLEARLARPAQPEAAPQPAEFIATRAADGRVSLRGRVPDERMRNAIESVARARFTTVDSALRVDPAVPGGWTVRVIAAIEAMSGLASGSAIVTPDLIRIEGVSGSSTASDAAAAALGRRLGAGADFALAIRYDRRQDADLALPSGQDCVDRANRVMATSEIGFEPAKSDFAGDVAPTIAALKDALRECGAFRIEVGGHTDAQGSDELNQALSQSRAQSVVAALAEAGIDTRLMTAAGYGESQPLASNDTEAGREANRRIEFRLLAPAPVEAAAPAQVAVVEGVTGDAAPAGVGAADTGAPLAATGVPATGLILPQLGTVPAELAAPAQPTGTPPEAWSLAARIAQGGTAPIASGLALQIAQGGWTGTPMEAAISLAAEIAGIVTDDEIPPDGDPGLGTPAVPNPQLGMAGPAPEGYTGPASGAAAADQGTEAAPQD